MDMTVPGVLLAGKWRTKDSLNDKTTDNKRNTLIQELSKHTNQSVEYFQRFDDDALIGKGAVVVFLTEAEIRDEKVLKNMSDDDQRNTLIVENNAHTDRPIPQLQAMSNQNLVQLGLEWFAKSRTVEAILDLSWKIDQAKVLEASPVIFVTKECDNSDSSIPIKETFIFEKEITNKSTFSHEHGFQLGVGVEIKFKAGIPLLAENGTTVKLEASTTHNWNFGRENSITERYSNASEVKLPPFKKIKIFAQITKANLNVPYAAKIRAADGSIKWIEGTWNGISTINFKVKPVEINEGIETDTRIELDRGA